MLCQKVFRPLPQIEKKSAKFMHILESNYCLTQVSLSYFVLFEKALFSSKFSGRYFNTVFYKKKKKRHTFCCSARSVKYNKDEKQNWVKTTLYFDLSASICLLSSSNLSCVVFELGGLTVNWEPSKGIQMDTYSNKLSIISAEFLLFLCPMSLVAVPSFNAVLNYCLIITIEWPLSKPKCALCNTYKVSW